MALRELSVSIAKHSRVIPIIEPVRNNSTTRISLDWFLKASMHFLLICNPAYGDFKKNSHKLFTEMIDPNLMEYDDWTPTLQVFRDTTNGTIQSFLDTYADSLAVVYWSLPNSDRALVTLSDRRIVHHAFVGNKVRTAYVNGIPKERRIMISDRFNRQPRNKDYPPRELFTDMNTTEGNPDRLDFGDFSIVGNFYEDDGGPAHAVTVHHIHYREKNAGPLDISHFISDRTDSPVDPKGKTIEAVSNLVKELPNLCPNNTDACNDYRQMVNFGNPHNLGYLKKVAIKHHLELMLQGGLQL